MRKTLLIVALISTITHAQMIRNDEKGIVYDTETKLLWQDDASSVEKTWDEAMDYCQNLSLGGLSNWRLPDIDTLKALYPKKIFLKYNNNSFYWSSSSNANDSYRTWLVYFREGKTNYSYKDSSGYIRCVRDSDPLFLNEVILISDASQEKKSQSRKTPFVEVQNRTQKDLNDFLSIPTIQQPTLPAPLNLVKDEFESKAEFAERVKRESAARETEIARLQEQYRRNVEARNKELENRMKNIEEKKKKLLFQNFVSVMGSPILSDATYDAESSIMYVTVSMSDTQWSKKVGIKIDSRENAKEFKSRLADVTTKVSFGYENDAFVLKKIDVSLNDLQYLATLTDTDYKPERVAVTIENKKVAFNELQNPNLVDKYQVSALGYGESATAKGLKYNDDLTPLIQKAPKTNEDAKKWLFAIAVEQYDEADAVTFAKNSANAFVTAAQKRFGISPRNTYALIDDKATSGSIKDKLELMLGNVKEGDSVYFYYSGHGIPNPSDGEAYMLPKDKVVDFITKEKEFMLRNVYKQLSDSKASKVIAFMDSCFSGNTDGISNIKGVAATRVKTKQVEFDKEKMVVLTAGNSNQFSNAFSEKGHRLFSYYLTRSIIERPSLDIDSLYKEVAVKVKDESHKMGDLKLQEPQIEGNTKIEL